MFIKFWDYVYPDLVAKSDILSFLVYVVGRFYRARNQNDKPSSFRRLASLRMTKLEKFKSWRSLKKKLRVFFDM